MLTLVDRNNTDIILNEIDSYFDNYYEFHLDKAPGLQIAFGLTAYDSNYDMLDEPEFVEVKARIRSWSPEQDLTKFTDINIRQCTKEELGLGDDETIDQARFYPAHPRSEAYLSRYWKKLYCFDEEVGIAGDYQSDRAVSLQL